VQAFVPLRPSSCTYYTIYGALSLALQGTLHYSGDIMLVGDLINLLMEFGDDEIGIKVYETTSGKLVD